MRGEIAAIVFVYNADGGFVHALLDSAHKALSPSTYQCRLCALTHHSFGMRGAWKRFVASLGVEVGFAHRDEWRRQLAAQGASGDDVGDVELPAIFGRFVNERVEMIVSALAIGECATVGELEALVRTAIGM